MIREGICLECGAHVKENHEYEKESESFGKCPDCANDGWVLGGILIPWHRRYVLCRNYYNVRNLDCRNYKKDDVVELIYTTGKKKGQKIVGKVIYSMYFGDNPMFPEQTLVIKVAENKHIYVTDTWNVEAAFDALFDYNQETALEWKSKIMKINRRRD